MLPAPHPAWKPQVPQLPAGTNTFTLQVHNFKEGDAHSLLKVDPITTSGTEEGVSGFHFPFLRLRGHGRPALGP